LKHKLNDLIGIKSLEKMMKAFYKLTEIGSIISDLQGNILAVSGYQKLCHDFCYYQQKKTCPFQTKCFSLADNINKYYRICQCPNGLSGMNLPIKVEGEHLADIFIGLIFLEKPDRDFFRKQTLERKIDFQQYWEILDSMKIFSREQFNLSIEYMTNLLEMVSSIGLTGLKKDILFRQQTARALRESEARLSSILQNMQIMMDAFDEDGNVVVWNRECEIVTGYSATEIIGNDKVWEYLYPNKDYRNEILDKVSDYDNFFRAFETKIVTKEGIEKNIAWSNISKQFPIPGWKYWAVGVDITKEKKIQEELRQTVSKLNVIFEAIPDYYFLFNSQGIILDMKEGKEKELNIVKEEAIGKRIQQIFPIKVSKQFEEALKKITESKELVVIDFNLFLCEKGKFFEARLVPLLNDQVIALVRNITEQKQREAEFLRIEKLESLGILAAGIAHDFNNILTAIIGNLALTQLYAERENKEKMLKCLLEAENASQQAKELSYQMLTFAKGGSPILKTVSLAQLVCDAAKLVLCGSNVSCTFKIADDLWPVDVDIGQIRQVINNLIINAQQAMPEGGEITLSISNIQLTEKDKLSFPNGKYVKMEITDQGIGISAEYLEKIFDPYFTTKQKGSGLGLATVYSIIKKHNGYINVYSKQGIGTSFFIYLPASHNVLAEEKLESKKLYNGNEKILVMDDEEMVRDVVGEMLNLLGYKVEFAIDGQAAIEKYKKAKEEGYPFSLVLMDLTVPGGMGGREALKRLQQIDSQVKAIVSSGYADNPIIANYRDYGFQDAVVKPYDVEELSKVLQKVLFI